jgi:hypothetical protein
MPRYRFEYATRDHLAGEGYWLARSAESKTKVDPASSRGIEPGKRTAKPTKTKPGETTVTNPGCTTTTLKYQIGDIVQWRHDRERVATGTVVSVVSNKHGSLYDVEIHFNPGLLNPNMSEDRLQLVHPDTLRDTLETIQAALKALDAGVEQRRVEG